MSSLPLLDVRHLTVAFNDRTVVDHLSFAVRPGEIVALLGESGSGKTIAARAVLGLLPYGACVTAGEARFKDRDLFQLDEASLRRLRGVGIGMIFQEPMTSLNPSMTVGRQMAEGLKLHFGFSDATCREKCAEMLARVRIADPDAVLDSYPHQFSGGMRQRISIAAAMLLRPALLIADEPTTALDVLVQREVLDLLVTLTRETGTGVLLITHDLGLVAQYADHIVVMRNGQLVEAAPADALLRAPREAYTQALLAAVPGRDAREPSQPAGAELVRIEDLHVRFTRRGRLPWRRGSVVRSVDGITLSVRRGETLAVVGESGSGKTTLVRSVLRLVDIESGRVIFDGTDVTALPQRALADYRRRVRIVFQDPVSALDPRMRIGDIVAEGLRHERGLAKVKRAERVRRILDEVGLGEHFAQRLPHQLSGGQRQRVNIARALIADPELLIADEPVSALDVTVQAEILRLLTRLQTARGFACLFISHALGVVEQIADRVAVIHRGRIVEVGSRDDIFDRPRHPYTHALLNAAPRIEGTTASGYRLAPYPAQRVAPPKGCTFSPWQGPGPPDELATLLDVAPGHCVACIPDINTGTRP